MATKVAVERPPGTDECLRRAIVLNGVIHPVVMSPQGDIIEGSRRAEIATDLGVLYKIEIQETRNPVLARQMIERARREADERYSTFSGQIVQLASQRDDEDVGVWPEEVIAAALGVSVDHVLAIMRRHLTPGPLDVRDMFPARRRRVDGTVGDAAVTTVGVAPVVRKLPAPLRPELHEVLTYIPESNPVEMGELRASLEKHGQKKPILLSRNGLLVDGRARWEILTEMGVTPEVRTVEENPWETALMANVDRFPNMWERLLILANMPARTSPTMIDDQRQPTVAVAANCFRVTNYALRSLRMIVAGGSPNLVKAVTEDVIKIGSALRIMREVPREEWDAQIELMREQHALGVDVALPMKTDGFVATVRDNRGRTANRGKGRVITDHNVQVVIDALDALGMVMEGSDGLDPRITDGQAAELMSRLSTARRPLGRLNTMLRQRKERT